MKRLSMIAAGLLALGLTAARAETAGKSNTTVEVVPPTAPNTDANGNAEGAERRRREPQSESDAAAREHGGAAVARRCRERTEALPPSPAGERRRRRQSRRSRCSRRRRSTQPGVRPPARVIDANTAAITGARARRPSFRSGRCRPLDPAAAEAGLPARAHLGRRGMGAGILVGGGFEDFTNNTMQNMTGTAGTWTARVLAGTRQFVGVEAAYVGNARSHRRAGPAVERRAGRRTASRATRA